MICGPVRKGNSPLIANRRIKVQRMFNMNFIRAMVGDELRVIPMVIFQDVFDELAARYRAEGLRGEDLDIAIRDALPWRLAEVCSATVH